ncbi:MAG: peptidoglycan synthetase [Saprospiraceae bacterium]|nr:peptidoglycan synthetase [Saprospiraceae bacterium]
MRIHLIAIGGSVMHNLAISLQKAGHTVSGSDDEIYDPARTRLEQQGLLPREMGWNEASITDEIELVILGMHARKDNPELSLAVDRGIRVVSFPEFIAEHSADKRRVVVAGSHGKTTTTSIIMHVLKHAHAAFDYLVGAQLEGFDTMVGLTDAPLMIIEGDEYLSSAIDLVPKIWHYRPQLAILTGIAWDHMNVFPTKKDYIAAFAGFLQRMPDGSHVYYADGDQGLKELVLHYEGPYKSTVYRAFEAETTQGSVHIKIDDKPVPLQIFGAHNLANLKGAYQILQELGVSDATFTAAITTFQGAAKRLQTLVKKPGHLTLQDFAHAPSKVRATVAAVRDLYPSRSLTACVELHTYSSLNQDFLPEYKDAMAACDQAIVFYSRHTLAMKKMPPLELTTIKQAFGRQDLIVFDDAKAFENFLREQSWIDHNLLLMSSGTFGGLDLYLAEETTE